MASLLGATFAPKRLFCRRVHQACSRLHVRIRYRRPLVFFLSAAEALDSAHQLINGEREFVIDDTHPPLYFGGNKSSMEAHVELKSFVSPYATMIEIIIAVLWSGSWIQPTGT